MKIYLASGFTVSNEIGRERELLLKFGIWNRLLSFYFFKIDDNYGREMLELKQENYENISS